MSALANSSSIFLDTSKFAVPTTTPSFITAPPVDFGSNPVDSNVAKIPILSDDDIKLPELVDQPDSYPDLPENFDWNEYYADLPDFDPNLLKSETELNVNPQGATTGSAIEQPSDLDLGGTDDTVDAIGTVDTINNTADAANISKTTGTEPTTTTEFSLDFFKDYNFDDDLFATDTTDSSTPATTAPDDTEFSLDFFQDYNFQDDLFADEKTEEEKEAELLEEWFGGFDEDYVEKTDEEKEKEDREFEEEWASYIIPPEVYIANRSTIDLQPLLLWGPPLLAMGVLFLLFTPCMCLMLRDNKREKKGKQRHYGLPRLVKNIHREMYEKTPSGQWKKIKDSSNYTCVEEGGKKTGNGFQQNISLDTAPVHTRNEPATDAFTQENELDRSRSPSGDNSKPMDSVSNFSNSGGRMADRSIGEKIEAKEVDLGEGVSKENPNGASNWSMY